MLTLKKIFLEKIILQCKEEFPNEACGILAGKSGRVEKVYEMANSEKSSQTFFMDPKEQLIVFKKMRQQNQK